MLHKTGYCIYNTIRNNTRYMSTNPLYLIGQGFTNCVIPSFIKHHFLTNPHIYTPYTPYQSEISQGRLELLYTYQNIIQSITQKDIAVASLIDNGQVGMDLLSLMCSHTKKNKVFIQKSLTTPLINCLLMRAYHQNIEVIFFDSLQELKVYEKYEQIKECAGIFIQTPCKYGNITDLSYLKDIKKLNNKILVSCATDLMFLCNYSNTDIDVIDFMFGNGGNMGVGLNYGGPQPAFLASNGKYIRLLPGRIIGKTVDIHNKEGYRMALQTREQHIKREKATSNVCTSQVLLANMSASWCMYNGVEGLQKKAKHINNITKNFVNELAMRSIPIVNNSYFNTITVSGDNDLHQYLQTNNIYSYKQDDNTVTFTFDETHNKDTIERILNVYDKKYDCLIEPNNINGISHIHNSFKERKQFFFDVVCNSQDEQTIMRYLHKLQIKDYSLMNGMIPLGSCTMKHTPHEPMEKLTNKKWNIHPYVPIEHTPHKDIVNSLTKHLCQVSGFDTVFYQSQSGAMGEYAGLATIREYLNDDKRNIILMPRSAHGTNSSSSVLAGYVPIYINETDDGCISMEHIKTLINKYGDTIAGLMITYPSTYGLYEPNIKEINDLIHNIGGQVYLDGANMNALLGMDTLPAELGFDVCHFNLHKTFCIPHGGGGPGMGPIAVKSHLISSLPSFSINSYTKSISTSQYGSGSLLLIPEHYISNKTMDLYL